jgi:hypothetical protein
VAKSGQFTVEQMDKMVDPGLIRMMLKIGYYVSVSTEYADLLRIIFSCLMPILKVRHFGRY